MQHLLYKYLVLNGSLDLPELGRLQLQRYPAAVNAHQLVAPGYTIAFEETEVHPSRELFAFLATESNSDDLSAIAAFNEWLAGFKQSLQQGTAVTWEQLGVFRKTENGQVVLSNTTPLLQGPSFSLSAHQFETIVAEEEEVVQRPDQYWWIYAIVLLLLALAAIAYRYL